MAKPNYHYENLTKSQQECLALIESLGIYELRALARVFGGNSPTTLKRNDHIVIVMDKIISGEDLKPLPLRQGRPYKELSNIEGILTELSKIAGKDYTLNTNQSRPNSQFQKIVSFKQIEDKVVRQKLFPIEVRGIVCKKSETELYITNQDNGKMVLIENDRLSEIREYDYITGTAIIMNEDKEYLLDSITSINYQPADKYVCKEESYDMVVPSQKIDHILLGSRYLMPSKSFLEKSDEVKNLISKLKKNNVVCLALIPNVLYENYLSYASLGFSNCFLIKYDERPFAIYETLILFMEHIKRLQKQGVSVAAFIQDIPTLINTIDFSAKATSTFMGHNETTVEILKQLMLLARASENNYSTTLFSTFDDADMFDPLYVSSVYKISKKL